jgi:peptidoglycan/xylan/chitin deacetylase (PgdA/CDA1 family)
MTGLIPGPVLRLHSRIATAVQKPAARVLIYRASEKDGNAWDGHFLGLRIGGTTRRRIHPTFDDGPDLVNTPKLLDELKRAGVLATFFVVGKNLETPQGKELLQRAALRAIRSAITPIRTPI